MINIDSYSQDPYEGLTRRDTISFAGHPAVYKQKIEKQADKLLTRDTVSGRFVERILIARTCSPCK